MVKRRGWKVTTFCFVASWIIGSLGCPRVRQRQRTVAKVAATPPPYNPRHTTNPGLLQRVDILGVPGGCQKGETWEPMQHSAPGFEKPAAGDPSPTPCHLNPLYPGHATRSTLLTTGPSPWLPQFPPSISSFAGYQRGLLRLVKFCSGTRFFYRIPALYIFSNCQFVVFR